MKKFIFLYILFISSVVYAQFNPPQNLEVFHDYIFPDNYYCLSWDPPEPGNPELVNYNIYRNWEVIVTVPANVLTYSEVNAPPDSSGIYIYYYITAIYENPDGESPPSNIVQCGIAISVDENDNMTYTSLLGNYPNPFNSRTYISFSLHKDTYVTLSIYNLKGKVIKTILNEKKLFGENNVIWDGKDNLGKSVCSGIYFYKLKTEEKIIIKKMILLK